MVIQPNEPLLKQVEEVIRPLDVRNKKLLMAFSGGVDSRVLLECLAKLKNTLHFKLLAMHVHHGLSQNADQWADFCQTTCNALDVPIEIVHVTINRAAGIGIEAVARQARYEALASASADLIVLAHHKDDQAETFLLQLMRGAGVKGLSAMASHDDSRRLVRPFLDTDRSAIEAFAKKHELTWIEDESNSDARFDRNFLRHQIIPTLQERYPSLNNVLARSASHMAEASQLLDELAEIDAKACLLGKQLKLEALASLSDTRARNLLRWWLASNQQPLPNTQRLQEMLRQLITAKSDSLIRVAVDVSEKVYLRRYKDLAYIDRDTESETISFVWNGEPELALPDGSVLKFEKGIGSGLAYSRLGIQKLRISQRVGGERFKPYPNKPTRTVKHLLQEANIPPWLRNRVPMIYFDDKLAMIPGIGEAYDLQAGEKEDGLEISWFCQE